MSTEQDLRKFAEIRRHMGTARGSPHDNLIWLAADELVTKNRQIAALTARVAIIEDALAQCIDDFDDGHSVCPATKAQAVAAMSGNPDGSFDAMKSEMSDLAAEVATLRADNERLRAQMLEMAERSAAKGQS